MELLQGLADELRGAAHGTCEPIVQRGMRMLGVTRSTLYQRLRKVGWSSGRKLRADRGDSRVSRAEVEAVAALMRSSQSTTGKQRLPLSDAIEIALANGELKTRVSPDTMLRIMRREGCHPAQLARATPHSSMRSLHPNHVWQLDASICVLYYLKNGKAAVMDERLFNARKPRDLARIVNKRVLRYALTDHFSGDVIARYYHAAGEDQESLFDFLMWAMRPQPGRVMHGVPWMLVWDAGSANMSHGIQNLLTALGVRHWVHVPGNPRAKGQVEGMHNIIERKFEGRLCFTRIDSIEQLNAHLDQWLLAFNGRAIHRRHKHTRDAVWQTIRPDQLRLCPPAEDCAVLMHSKPQPRVVAGNLTISFTPRGYESATYSVADVPDVRAGEKVSVVVNPYRAPAVFVLGKAEDGSVRYHECEPIALDDGGFFVEAPVYGERYAAPRDTDVDQARKAANELAYGERETLDANAAKAKGAVAFGGRIDPFADVAAAAEATPAFMQRRGTEIHLPNPMHVDERPLTLLDLAYELRARRGAGLSPAERERVLALHPESIPADAFPALVEQLVRGELPPLPEAPAAVDAPRLYAVR